MSKDKGTKEESTEVAAPAEGDAAADAAAIAKKAKKKKLIMIGGGVGAILIIVGVLFATGVLGGSKEDEHGKKSEHAKDGAHLANDPCLEPASGGGKKEAAAADPCKPVYVDVPDLIVNLATDGRRAHFVNLKLTLELKNAAASAEVTENMPRIVDSFNTYLREMTKEDLEGSEGLIRLEDEMRLRLDKILKPGEVTDILYKSVIVQ